MVPVLTITALTVAQGKCFVADCDAHTVHALDSETGRPAWTFTATGRVGSPPTIANGLAVFGSRDGYVYCLRASDGELVWRFRGAPEDKRVVAYGQLESLWSISGGVLVEDGAAVFAAGRSSFLDGGRRLCRVDLGTGKLVSESTIYTPDPPNLGNSSSDAHAAMQGQRGAKLEAVSTSEGAKKAELDLPALPVLDGMAAAGGCLYLSLKDGTVICLGKGAK